MVREQAVSVQCDRCDRVEMQPPAPPKTVPDFRCVFNGTELVYDDLCKSCRGVIANHLTRIFEQEFDFTQEKAPPLDSPPDYSPPKPHSPAAGKR